MNSASSTCLGTLFCTSLACAPADILEHPHTTDGHTSLQRKLYKLPAAWGRSPTSLLVGWGVDKGDDWAERDIWFMHFGRPYRQGVRPAELWNFSYRGRGRWPFFWSFSSIVLILRSRDGLSDFWYKSGLSSKRWSLQSYSSFLRKPKRRNNYLTCQVESLKASVEWINQLILLIATQVFSSLTLISFATISNDAICM